MSRELLDAVEHVLRTTAVVAALLAFLAIACA